MTIRWTPTTAPNIVLYVLLFSDTGTDGPFLERAQIMNAPLGPNWDPADSLYFYDDPDAVEVPYRLYRMSVIDTTGAIFTDTTSPPFADGNDPYTLPVRNTFPLDSDYTGIDALTCVDPNGEPVIDVTIRVYSLEDWAAQRYSKVVGLTKTTSTGRWKSPILVEPGNTYVVHCHKPNYFGPDTVEITV